MKKSLLTKLFSAVVIAGVVLTGCNTAPAPAHNNATQDIQIMSVDNSAGKITKESIEKAFKANGFVITGNNNMNTPFKKRFKAGDDFKMYRLMFPYHPNLTAKLAKEYPSIGLIAPLSTSVYSKTGKTLNIAALTLKGMSKITGIPESNKELTALYEALNSALESALPGGKFQVLNYKIKKPGGPLVAKFEATIEGDDLEEEKESFQEEFEAEVEPQGFIVAGFTAVQEDLVAKGVNEYDFYDTYSLCKLEVIYPVHKLHPEVGAFAPCSIYMYKKKGEEKTHIGFPSVYNWISSVDIEDAESIDPLIEAQGILHDVLTDLGGE